MMRLIPNFSRVWHKLWSARLAAFWGLISSIAVLLPALQDLIPLKVFAGATIIVMVAIAVARFLKQPGLD